MGSVEEKLCMQPLLVKLDDVVVLVLLHSGSTRLRRPPSLCLRRKLFKRMSGTRLSTSDGGHARDSSLDEVSLVSTCDPIITGKGE